LRSYKVFGNAPSLSLKNVEIGDVVNHVSANGRKARWQIVSKFKILGEKSSFFGPKVSKILNRAENFKNLLSFYDVGVINLQYFCRRKRDCLIV
jgi:hypothetical protein